MCRIHKDLGNSMLPTYHQDQKSILHINHQTKAPVTSLHLRGRRYFGNRAILLRFFVGLRFTWPPSFNLGTLVQIILVQNIHPRFWGDMIYDMTFIMMKQSIFTKYIKIKSSFVIFCIFMFECIAGVHANKSPNNLTADTIHKTEWQRIYISIFIY